MITSRLLTAPTWVAVMLLVLVSGLARAALGVGVEAPWIGTDESFYGLLGRALYGEHTVLGDDLPHASLVTPLLVGLPQIVLDDLASAVSTVQVVQAFAMSTAAVVAYIWARSLVGVGWSLAAAVLVALVPGMAYSGLLMTEALFYPVSALALWSLARVVQEPRLSRHLVFAGALVLAVATRLQALALIPAAVLALAFAAALTRRSDLARAAAAYLGALVVAAAVLAALLLRDVAALGVYSGALTESYSIGAIVRDVWWHVGGLYLACAGAPLIALLALAPMLRRRFCPPPALVGLVAVTLSWTLVLVVQVGVFASRYVGHLAERDLLSALPPLLVVLVVWCARGGASLLWTGAAALLVAVPAVLLPIDRLATVEARLDSFSTIALQRLAEVTSEETLSVAWPVVAAAIAFVAVVLAGRGRVVVALAVGLCLATLAAFAQAEVRTASAADARWWFADASPRWIDGLANGPVAWIHAEPNGDGGVWKSAFWNRRVDRVLGLGGAVVGGAMPTTEVELGPDGSIVDSAGARVVAPYAVAPLGMALAGTEVGRVSPSGGQPGHALWAATGPLRALWWVRGIQPNGDLVRGATIDAWRCGGVLEVTLLGKEPAVVAFDVAGGARTSVRIGPNELRVARVTLPRAQTCRVGMTTTALVGTTRIARQPA